MVQSESQFDASSWWEVVLEQDGVKCLAIDRYELAIGAPWGTIVRLTERSPWQAIARSHGMVQLPQGVSVNRQVGREPELQRAIAVLQQESRLEIFGPSGIGKSHFLRQLLGQLAQQPETISVDSILYNAQSLPLMDLLQWVCDSLYEVADDVKPSIVELQQMLQAQRILLVLDSCQLSESELQRLTAFLLSSKIIVVSIERRFWQAQSSIELAGLSGPEAMTLVSADLKQVNGTEAAIAQVIDRVQGSPQRVLQVVALMTEEGLSVKQVLEQLPDAEPEAMQRALTRLILAALPKAQRWIIALLTAMGRVGLQAEQIAAMVGPPNPTSSLQALLRRRLIRLEGDRYALAAGLEMLSIEFNATPWMERVLAYLIPWVQAHQRQQSAVVAEREVLMQTLQWAVTHQRWQAVLSIVNAIAPAFALSKQWASWQQMLHWNLQAAWKLEDEQREAWSFHELGTLAFCHEEVTTAYDSLTDALQIRRSTLGNEVATEVTRHNLTQIKMAIVPPSVTRRSALWSHRSRTYRALILLGFGVFLSSCLVGSAIVYWMHPQWLDLLWKKVQVDKAKVR